MCACVGDGGCEIVHWLNSTHVAMRAPRRQGVATGRCWRRAARGGAIAPQVALWWLVMVSRFHQSRYLVVQCLPQLHTLAFGRRPRYGIMRWRIKGSECVQPCAQAGDCAPNCCDLLIGQALQHPIRNVLEVVGIVPIIVAAYVIFLM